MRRVVAKECFSPGSNKKKQSSHLKKLSFARRKCSVLVVRTPPLTLTRRAVDAEATLALFDELDDQSLSGIDSSDIDRDGLSSDEEEELDDSLVGGDSADGDGVGEDDAYCSGSTSDRDEDDDHLFGGGVDRGG